MTYNEESFAYEFYCKADIPVAADTKTEKTVDKVIVQSFIEEKLTRISFFCRFLTLLLVIMT